MRALQLAVTFATVSALLAGCSVNLGSSPKAGPPEIVWTGYLVELDGVAVGSSGIRLDIETARSEDPGAHRYSLATGCVAGGWIENSGQMLAYETLRPCREDDAERMMRLNHLSYSGNGKSPAGHATLHWTGKEATLESPMGRARFVEPEVSR
ncbi:hypothetical protein [Brevundimonas sp.]|uniref:hypothetical protein n=1 Tax=Brevundimonas sp. TaxID=1871086 RepID=UPI00262FF473|nr:hypothetical protein [Brevundimonas sp.]